MSMTREEAIETLENHTQYFVPVQDLGALNMAIADLRPVSREQAERMRGEWIQGGYACGEHEWECSKCHETEWRTSCSGLKFCPFCGAPMTDEAVEMVLDRWKEAVDNG